MTPYPECPPRGGRTHHPDLLKLGTIDLSKFPAGMANYVANPPIHTDEVARVQGDEKHPLWVLGFRR